MFDPASARLPDASELISPEIEKRLGITPEQHAEILSIIRVSNDAVQEVYRHAQDESSPLVRVQVGRLRRVASEQAKAVLTLRQQQQLGSLRWN